MSNTIFITANWTTGALSQQTISRQYDNNRYAVQFIGYPEGDGTEELDLYLLVWMSTAPGQKTGEITPIQLNSDQWYISNYFTQQVQVIKFQLCVLNEAGTYEAHSPIFSGRIGDSLEHNGTSHDIDVSTLFDAYREYLNELIIRAGAVVIDPTFSQSGQAADAKKTGDEITSLKSGLNEEETRAKAEESRIEALFTAPTQDAVDNWLDEHPEATTTVQDGAVTTAKLAGGSVTEAKLDTQLYKAYLRTETAMHFFPSLASGGYSGNSSLIVVKDKCVLFDCGPTVNWDAIKAYYDALYADGIFVNIDYIIISHYHWDHIQNLANILQRYPYADCKVYLPLDPTGYAGGTSEVLSIRTQVLETLAEYNLQYVEVSVDTDITILDGICSVNLFNSTPEDYAYYSADTSAVYNDYSMCALVKTGEVYALYPGDIQREAQIRILATKSLPKLVLYSTHHHAIQNDDFLPYLDAIEPEIAVIQTSYVRGLISAASSFATNYASEHVYSCGYGACVVAVGKDGGSLVEGRELPKTGWYYSYVDYYVDNEYQGTEHFGTEEKPFTNINEALMFARENSNMHYIIHVKATATPYEYVWCRDFSAPIVITGYADGSYAKPVVNGFYARNTADISLYNLDFTGTGREVNNIDCLMYASASTVYFSGCEFNNSGATFYSAIQCNLSTVYAASCIFNKLTTPFVTYRYAKFISNINTFTDCNKVYTVQNTDLTIRGADTITNCTNYIYAGNAGTKNITIKSVSSDSDLTALKSLIALNDLTVVSLPFYCNGILSIIKGKAIVPVDSQADRGTAINNGDNLNDYKTFGKYNSGATATTTSLTNTPTGVQGGFTLYVEPSSATYSKQILIDNNMQIFIRRLSSGGVWGSWFLVGMTQV